MQRMNHLCGPDTYYVHGSGLVPIPHERVNEVSRLRSEFHATEAKQAMTFAWTRKLA